MWVSYGEMIMRSLSVLIKGWKPNALDSALDAARTPLFTTVYLITVPKGAAAGSV